MMWRFLFDILKAVLCCCWLHDTTTKRNKTCLYLLDSVFTQVHMYFSKETWNLLKHFIAIKK